MAQRGVNAGRRAAPGRTAGDPGRSRASGGAFRTRYRARSIPDTRAEQPRIAPRHTGGWPAVVLARLWQSGALPGACESPPGVRPRSAGLGLPWWRRPAPNPEQRHGGDRQENTHALEEGNHMAKYAPQVAINAKPTRTRAASAIRMTTLRASSLHPGAHPSSVPGRRPRSVAQAHTRARDLAGLGRGTVGRDIDG